MSEYVWGDNDTEFFFHLTPELVLDSIDKLGLRTTGRCMTLNSMENRVYEVEIEKEDDEVNSPSDRFVVAKFYRPGRWTETQIRQEHQFLLDLQEVEIPVIAPLQINGDTLFKLHDHNIWYTLFPKKGGRAPDELKEEDLQIMGRLLARIHNVGAIKDADQRIRINPASFGLSNLKYLMEGNFLPPHLAPHYDSLVKQACDLMAPYFENIAIHRIHGDCHRGNIIWREQEGPFFIDFDDMLVGPAIQDIWLVVPGIDQHSIQERNILLDAYEEMREFDYRSLKLIEPLRTLRYIHFSAWMANRWDDPAFKNAFPYFGTENYWQGQANDLRVQIAAIQELGQQQYY